MSQYYFVFIILGALLFGMGAARVYASRSGTKKPYKGRGKREYYTYGELLRLRVGEWWRRVRGK